MNDPSILSQIMGLIVFIAALGGITWVWDKITGPTKKD